MTHPETAPSLFHEGEAVVLVEGTYQGTLGSFVRLREDTRWADIAECNGTVRSHPVEWLGHATDSGPDRRPVTTAVPKA